MIRLDKDHEARKVDTFLLRQQIQKPIPDSSLVCDVWHASSGIAILTPTPAKAAAILQYKDLIANPFGNSTVERQESSTTFIHGQISQKIQMIILDMSISTFHLIKHTNFLFDCNFFGLAVGIQRIQNRKSVPMCEKCFGFHSTRTCAREYMCKLYGTKRQEGPSSKPRQCLNCKGPHDSENIFCPARPQRKNGAFVRLSSDQLRHIRKAGHSDYLKAIQTHECSLVEREATECSSSAGPEE
ncbi:hypothetical protein EPUL_000235 [Erysiphe pulchra]|uniref:Uncharacterized protein n=1 Tax=Erysiphe pulchra TaxID=225359 RepID=A0A2S4Q119_9PEZI|nr:hypothetical protein EPUL_000235 [Erysiphe pulchra]